jgi:hypothetical protein
MGRTMSQVAASPTTGANSSSPQANGSRSHGRLLVLVRVAWGIAALIVVGSFAAQLPGHYADLQRVCTGPVCAYGQLSPSAAESFQQLGISLGSYAVLRTSLTLLVALTWFVIAAMLAWQKPNDWLALLVALWFIIAGTATITGAFGLGTGSTVQGHELYAHVVNLGAEYGLILVVFALFRTRRFAPRAAFWLLIGIGFFAAGPLPDSNPLTLPLRLGVLTGLLVAQIYHVWRFTGRELQWTTQWATIGLTVVIGVATAFLVIADVDRSLTTLATLLFYVAVAGAEVMQLSRYWQVAGPLGRQQTKWIAFGVAVFVILAAMLLAPVIFLPSLGTSGSFYQTIHTLVLIVVSLVGPVTITLAILRYRLWDIDSLINRTLVYGSLTSLLGALYAGLLISLESLAGLLNKQAGQPLVLVVSTLATAALIQPLRTRLQQVIDRRFYRRKYDAEKTLAAFSATLQNEVDLEQVRSQLLSVIEETMQPTQVTLWLRQPVAHPADHTAHA